MREERSGWPASKLRAFFARPICRHLYRIVVIVGLSLILKLFNPLGLPQAADNLMQDAVLQSGQILRIWPDYAPLRESGASQEEIAVDIRSKSDVAVTLVLWTDLAMQTLVDESEATQVWPISYGAHAGTLYKSIVLGAKVVFLDFLFLTRREDETWEEFEQVLTLDLPRSNTRLFIACDPEEGLRPAFGELVDIVKRANEAATSYRKSPTTVVSFVPATLPRDPVTRTYEMVVDIQETAPSNLKCGDANNFVNADGKISKSLTAVPSLVLAATEETALSVSSDAKTMTILWDRRTDAVTRALFPSAGAAPESWWAWLRQWIEGIFFNLSVLERKLAGAPAIPADRLYFASPDQRPHAQAINTITVKDLIKDRIVMIGSAQRAAADTRNSPIAANIPGVMVHAIAAENLLRFGDDYIQDISVKELLGTNSQLFGIGDLSAGNIILLVTLIFSAAVYSWTVEDKSRQHSVDIFVKSNNQPARRKLRLAILIGFGATIMISALMLNLRIPPTDWFSTVLSFSFISAPFVLGYLNSGIILIMYKKPNR